MASTSVVLPWSTCAINATLRKGAPDMEAKMVQATVAKPGPARVVYPVDLDMTMFM